MLGLWIDASWVVGLGRYCRLVWCVEVWDFDDFGCFDGWLYLVPSDFVGWCGFVFRRFV